MNNQLNAKTIRETLASRSTSVCLGTSNHKGEVNIAPVGSAFMPDDRSIVLLRGPLQQTYINLRENPEAVFMLANNSPGRWIKFFFTGKFGASFGYRIHVRLREEKALTGSDREAVLKKRFGFFAGLKGGRKIEGTLKQMLIFDITKTREIAPF